MTARAAEGSLVIGYGSTLRGDDGVGWHAARRLADDPRLAGTVVLARHQLTPELALDLSRAAIAVLIDADPSKPPGTFAIEPVRRSVEPSSAWSHRLDPGALVALAESLYGGAPDVWLVRVGVASVEIEDGLTTVVEAAVPAIVEAVVELVARATPVAAARSTDGPADA